MTQPIDYSIFDLPQIGAVLFYPQPFWSPAPVGATDHLVPVSDGVSVSARFYSHSKHAPSILFFHGNGEVACQYDDIARLYHEAGANLFVADYRGYGKSGGLPSFTTMLADAREVYHYFDKLLATEGYSTSRYVKGRSLGCHSAVEVAACFQDSLRGLIAESGSVDVERFAVRWGLPMGSPGMRELLRLHHEKVKSIRLPLLVIHGEQDELIPVEAAVKLYDGIGSTDKRIEIIPGAGHNDLLWIGLDQYFGAIQEFLAAHNAQ